MADDSGFLSSFLEERLKLLGLIQIELAANCDALRRLDLDAIHLHVFHLELLCGQMRKVDSQIRALASGAEQLATPAAQIASTLTPRQEIAAAESAKSPAQLLLANAAVQAEVRRKNTVLAGALAGTRKTFAALARICEMRKATYGNPQQNTSALGNAAGG